MSARGNIEIDPLAQRSLSPREVKQVLEARRGTEAFLVLRNEQGELVVHLLGRKLVRCTIGRHPDSDLAIGSDPEVSGLHAELLSLGGQWMLVDDGLSTNGTFVNGQRMQGRRRMHHGDRIRVGQTVMVLNLAQAGPVEATAAAVEDRVIPRVTDAQRRILVALCRPYRKLGGFATPASNQQIAEENFLSVDTVKMHLRALFSLFELGGLPQNEKRARLAQSVLENGLISQAELAD